MIGWIQIILAVLAFFLTKKKTGDTGKAALAAGATYLATDWVVNDTDWGKENLLPLNESVSSFFGLEGTVAIKDEESGVTTVVDPKTGEPVKIPAGYTVVPGPDGAYALKQDSTGLLYATADVLKTWGGTGTAAVIGTTAAATGTGIFDDIPPWVIWAGILGGGYLLLKD